MTDRGADARDAAFRAAVQHSRRVRLLRLGLPSLAIFLCAAFVWRVVHDPRSSLGPQLEMASMGLTGATITMQSPRLTGFDKEQRPYEVTAVRAEQSLVEPSKIDLTEMNARMVMRDKGWVTLAALQGHLDTEHKLLGLKGSVKLKNELGDNARLESARVDFGGGTVHSDEPVELNVGRNTLTAQKMQILDNGDRAIFEGKVVMTLRPESKTATEGAAP
jgi:lipopolysaccharide export system protein LptC